MDVVFLLILAVGFGGAGVAKLAGVQIMRDNFERWAVPDWSRPIVGVIEVAIAALAVAGIGGSEGAQQIAALLGLWVMVGAIVIHAMAGDKIKEVAPAIFLLVCSLLLLFTQEV